MDGNRRWATGKGLPKIMGHTEGAKQLENVARAVKNRGIPYMTVYALSTENLNRSEKELKHLFMIFNKLAGQLKKLLDEGVQIRIIGNTSLLPKKTATILNDIVEKTKNNTALILTLAIAYGGQDEIVRGVNKAIEAGEPVTETTFVPLLDTGSLPPVDLIVRTGGHQRLSNFLLWNGAYAELYFTDTYWPAFDDAELDTILAWFEEQQRNHGK